MNEPRSIPPLEARRLEEMALNASGAFQCLIYDGWLLGYRPGPTKRLRCVNSFYRSSLPLPEKVEYCTRFYQAVGLPAVFRLLPFSQPPELDTFLDAAGWAPFDRTCVLRVKLADLAPAALPRDAVAIMPVVEWVRLTARLLDVDDEALPLIVARASDYPLPHAGAVILRDGEVVACGLVKIEEEHAGLFALKTATSHRGEGLGRAIVAGLLAEARRRGVRYAYLQVTADNAPALALYDRFGFALAYEYWYRGHPGSH